VAASPTLRRRRLSKHLDRARQAAGLTAEETARRAKQLRPDRPWSAAKVVRIEGRDFKRLRSDDVLTLLDVYGIEDRATRSAYVRLAMEASQTGWWVGYKDVLGAGAYVDLENEAREISTFQASVMPGLLQVEDYARAVIVGDAVTDDREVERRVEARMMRQQLLTRSDRPRLHAVVDESAFRKLPADCREKQINHLLDVQDEAVQVQVLLDSTGPHAAMSGSFVILGFPDDPSVVYLEQATSELFPESAEEVAHYGMLFENVCSRALSVTESRDWMHALLT
jgi:hypothetical protein